MGAEDARRFLDPVPTSRRPTFGRHGRRGGPHSCWRNVTAAARRARSPTCRPLCHRGTVASRQYAAPPLRWSGCSEDVLRGDSYDRFTTPDRETVEAWVLDYLAPEHAGSPRAATYRRPPG